MNRIHKKQEEVILSISCYLFQPSILKYNQIIPSPDSPSPMEQTEKKEQGTSNIKVDGDWQLVDVRISFLIMAFLSSYLDIGKPNDSSMETHVLAHVQGMISCWYLDYGGFCHQRNDGGPRNVLSLRISVKFLSS